jgi:hypothetical protein
MIVALVAASFQFLVGLILKQPIGEPLAVVTIAIGFFGMLAVWVG